jgi:predicted transcriptional regulator of viral defense system
LGVRAWRLAKRQHGVVARWQLIAIGFTSRQIEHRVAKGRLHPLWRGVYTVGRPQVGQHGRWMAAVLACGAPAVLSHRSAAALWGIWREAQSIEVSIPAARIRRRPGIRVYRRANLELADIGRHHGIPVTQPICTLVDLAARLPAAQLEAAVNEADKLGLVDPEALRAGLDGRAERRGAPALRKLLDRPSFALTTRSWSAGSCRSGDGRGSGSPRPDGA